jgi:hypothetical protein
MDTTPPASAPPPITLRCCHHHATREAVARCPGCARFFCRECVSPFDHRLLCAECLAQIARPAAVRAPARPGLLVAALQGVSALILAGCAFYVLGGLLAAMPNQFQVLESIENLFEDAVVE